MSGPFGMRLVKSAGMEGFTGNLFEYDIDPANTNPIFTGDPVLLSGGYIEEVSDGNTDVDYAGPILGIFAGCRYVDDDGSYKFNNFWSGAAGRTEAVANVVVPGSGLVWIREATGAGLARAAIGARHGVAYGAGSTQTGQSGFTLGAASAIGGLLLHRPAALPGNVISSSAAIIWEASLVAAPNLYA